MNLSINDENRKCKEAALQSILDEALNELDLEYSDDIDSSVDKKVTNNVQGRSKNNSFDAKNVEYTEGSYIAKKSAKKKSGNDTKKGSNVVHKNNQTATVNEGTAEKVMLDLSSDDKGLKDFLQQIQQQIEVIENNEYNNKNRHPGNTKKLPMSKTNGNNSTYDVDKTIEKMIKDLPNIGEIEPSMFDKAAIENSGDQLMKQMMQEYERMSQKGDANDIVDGVMNQLLSKEIMYEPMKKVTERFPQWLADNKDKLTNDEYNRYGHQYQYFQRIVLVYEKDPTNISQLMELMEDIQEFGQPPSDIIKELAPDLDFDKEGFPQMGTDMELPPFMANNNECPTM